MRIQPIDLNVCRNTQMGIKIENVEIYFNTNLSSGAQHNGYQGKTGAFVSAGCRINAGSICRNR